MPRGFDPRRLAANRPTREANERRHFAVLAGLSGTGKTRLAYPPNLVFLGTVNMDETTMGLSDKVLDRAFTVEFWEVNVTAWPGWDDCALSSDGVAEVRTLLSDLMDALRPARLHFGWRVIAEVVRYLEARAREGGELDEHEALDRVIYAKVLPKLRGDDSPRLQEARLLRRNGPGGVDRRLGQRPGKLVARREPGSREGGKRDFRSDGRADRGFRRGPPYRRRARPQAAWRRRRHRRSAHPLRATAKARGGFGGLWSVSRECRPDLALVWTRGNSTGRVVRDAKYRIARDAILSGMAESSHLYHDALRWGSVRPEASLLLVPDAGAVPWLGDETYVRKHGVGAVALRPGVPPPSWLRGLFLGEVGGRP